ncbi:uncharacterized protein LOC143280144 [Babylonia areolata]|uniref:uncharacterized protein LOC143280144 n=1 Tax=Babylonia areolata TaxID=304850 RepID=UPI003FCFCF69
MGVGRENKDIFFGPYVQDNDMHILENQSGQSTDEEDLPAQSRTNAHQSSPRRRLRTRPRSSSLEACLTGMYRRCGARQARRTDHIKHLLSLGKDGEQSSDVLTPTYSTKTSPFAQLLQQRDKMQAWNDFINSSEEDQERILQMRKSAPRLTNIQEESDEESSEEDDSDDSDADSDADPDSGNQEDPGFGNQEEPDSGNQEDYGNQEDRGDQGDHGNQEDPGFGNLGDCDHGNPGDSHDGKRAESAGTDMYEAFNPRLHCGSTQSDYFCHKNDLETISLNFSPFTNLKDSLCEIWNDFNCGHMECTLPQRTVSISRCQSMRTDQYSMLHLICC